MGGGASSNRRPPPEPTAADVAGLGQPFSRNSGESCFYCLPYDDEFKRRSAVVVLEVGTLGFRLMRPNSDDCLYAYPWGQIHSWAHTDNRFSFRYFDDGKRKVVQYVLYLRDMGQLLTHIQTVIDAILAERKSMAIPPEKFAELMEELKRRVSSGGSAVQLLSQGYSSEYYFWSEQGRQLMDAIASSFDKVEVAVMLHGRLIDQNRFSYMLEGLEAQTDRDNVWHRITVQKKLTAQMYPGSMGSPGSTSKAAAKSPKG